VRSFRPHRLHETDDDISPQHNRATIPALGKRGAAMSTIIDLLFREYLKTKLAEMKALPAKPAGK
jgi:hypothetical protein